MKDGDTQLHDKIFYILFYIDLVNEKLNFRSEVNHDLTTNRSETRALHRFIPLHLQDWIFFLVA